MQIKILSWNIWYNCYFDQVKDFLKSADAEIIGLQEVVSDDKSRDVISFLKELGYEYIFAPAFNTKNDGRTVGNAIFSKYPILNKEVYILTDSDRRNAIRANIQIDKKLLHIFCTHLLHTHQQPSEIQEFQAEKLSSILTNENTILMGDFNAMPNSAAIKKVGSILTNTDSTFTPTWGVYPKGCDVCKPQTVDIRLDYIFVSADVKFSSVAVESSKGSDHLPISIKIEI